MRTQKLKVRGYSHHFGEQEDLIRNVSPPMAMQMRKKWEYLQKLERERRAKDPNFQGFYSNIQNDFTRMLCKMRTFEEIITTKKKRKQTGQLGEILEERPT